MASDVLQLATLVRAGTFARALSFRRKASIDRGRVVCARSAPQAAVAER